MRDRVPHPGAMTEFARFDPIYPAHAIERCAATIAFSEPVPGKIADRIKAAADASLHGAGLLPQGPAQSFGIQIDATTGRVIPLKSGPMIVTYTNAERSLTCTVAPTALVWTTTRYVRWEPFAAQLAESINPLLLLYADAVPVEVVKLEYLDRFFWSGTWADMRADALLRFDTGFVAAAAARGGREWHSHAGWFSFLEEPFRRLVNVNVDVTSAVKPGDTAACPSAAILTMMQDQAVSGPEDDGQYHGVELPGDPISRLGDIHTSLKSVLRDVIVAEMGERIGLGN
jgi:uncharacterized protein (TIGR04255 family)